MAIKLEGGGGKALMAWPLEEELFLRLPLLCVCFLHLTNERMKMERTRIISYSHNWDRIRG